MHFRQTTRPSVNVCVTPLHGISWQSEPAHVPHTHRGCNQAAASRHVPTLSSSRERGFKHPTAASTAPASKRPPLAKTTQPCAFYQHVKYVDHCLWLRCKKRLSTHNQVSPCTVCTPKKRQRAADCTQQMPNTQMIQTAIHCCRTCCPQLVPLLLLRRFRHL